MLFVIRIDTTQQQQTSDLCQSQHNQTELLSVSTFEFDELSDYLIEFCLEK